MPALKKAMQRGIKVISWDSGVAKEGRHPAAQPVVQRADRQDVPDARQGPPEGGGRLRHPVGHHDLDQPEHLDRRDEEAAARVRRVNLVTTVYGDDLSDKSYREAKGLLKPIPNLKAIIAPTTVGVSPPQGGRRRGPGRQGLRHRPRPAV
jgi:rhamnose transport system substrate-binding protein